MNNLKKIYQEYLMDEYNTTFDYELSDSLKNEYTMELLQEVFNELDSKDPNVLFIKLNRIINKHTLYLDQVIFELLSFYLFKMKRNRLYFFKRYPLNLQIHFLENVFHLIKQLYLIQKVNEHKYMKVLFQETNDLSIQNVFYKDQLLFLSINRLLLAQNEFIQQNDIVIEIQ